MTALRESGSKIIGRNHQYLFDHDAAKRVPSKQKLAPIRIALCRSVFMNKPEESQGFLFDPIGRELMDTNTESPIKPLSCVKGGSISLTATFPTLSISLI